MPVEQRDTIIREINRIYSSKFQKNTEFKEHINRTVTFRMEELKREVNDNKWKMSLLFVFDLLRKNP
jgi:hypothetical protein